MAQVGFPRLFSVYGSIMDPRWDIQTAYPTQIAAVQSAKTANPNLIVLMAAQAGISFPIPNVTYGSGSFEAFGGATDGVVDGSAANAGVIRPYSVFWDKLYNANGTVTGAWGTGSHLIWNLANGPYATGLEDTWQTLGRFLLYRLKQNRLYRDPWDGYWSDNVMSVGMGGYGGSSIDSDRNGVVDAGSTLRTNFINGLFSLLKYLSDSLPGKTLGGNVLSHFDPRSGTWAGNATDKDGWHKYANISMIENGEFHLASHTMAQRAIDIGTSTDSSIDGATGTSRLGWNNYPDPYGRERYFVFMYQIQDAAGNYIALPANYNSPSVYKQEVYYKPYRHGLALSCCAGGYYDGTILQQHGTRWFYDDEMLGGTNVNARNWMGQPIGVATSPVSGVFMRQFDGGLAIVNVNSTGQTVTLPGAAGSWRKIAGTASHNDGALISGTTFTIPARDGRLLVRIGVAPPPPLAPVNQTLPTLSGTAVSGQALTPTYGTWLNTPTSYSVVFARYSSGGTRTATLQTQSTLATYTLVAGDVGSTIRLEVTATNSTGSSAAISSPTAVVQTPPELGADDALGGPGSTIRDFSIASESLPSSIFPASGIRDFSVSPNIVGRLYKRIYGPALLPNISTAFYTVLNGRRTIIRHIHVSNPSASPVDFTLAIGTDTPGTRLWNGQPIAADSILQHFRDHTLEEGETLLGFAGTNNVLTLTVDGYEESIDISQ